ncbi:hypothetical protein Lepto7376_2251 [[Leptolyngbya] sp. PCC 7376]|uniref:hypothetical protein n=1 Tax=[Leptolyngbya] sp. PCC 7376 TaxID=111781 RepID=UPI00029F2586|nr:hypothetical protein [[Leptolyngbya] sp. PCC 7376]AFY38541.1 hypothetical protein Lepto7376_2251 [[Leptolyngbya] sp. PCC 7376]
MKQAPFFATLVNGSSLVLLGIWGYVASGSITALIPVGLGLAFFALSPGVKSYNKAIAHVVAFLALATLAALVPPFLRVLGSGNGAGIFRIGVMLLTTAAALGFYVKSFIDARRSRKNASESE